MTETKDRASLAGTAREQYIEGLLMLADFLEVHPELPLPTHGTDAHWALTFHLLHADDPKGGLADFVRAVPGRVEKRDNDQYFRVGGRLAGLHIEAVAYRDAVCQRVVVGTETVTEMVPDPEVVKNAPLVEVTTEVEQVRWECSPLLADDAVAVSQ